MVNKLDDHTQKNFEITGPGLWKWLTDTSYRGVTTREEKKKREEAYEQSQRETQYGHDNRY